MLEDQPIIPTHAGVGLAAVILGGACVPLAALLGAASLTVSLPTFGVWYFLPVVVLAIALGMFASRTATGVAGAILGVAALLVCMTFIVVDRLEGPAVRAQLDRAAATKAPPAGLSSEQLQKMMRNVTTRPG